MFLLNMFFQKKKQDFQSIGSPISDFTVDALKQIEDALDKAGYVLWEKEGSHITLEYNAYAQTQNDGSIRVYVVEAGIKASNSNSQKIIVNARKKSY